MASFGNKPLQAAAQEVTAREVAPRGAALGRRKDSPLNDPMEDRTWRYFDHLEEIYYPAQSMANLAGLVSYFPAETPAAGDELSDPQPSEDRRVLDMWQSIGGEQAVASWVSDLVLYKWVPGQAWLCATRMDGGRLRLVATDDTDAEWRVLSSDDLLDAGGFRTLGEVPSADARFWRIYTPHKQKRSRPDSPVRHVADDCELLMLYQADLKGSARARAAAGIKALPSRLQNERLDNGKTWADQLVEDLNAYRNPDSPASRYPLLAWLDGDDLETFTSDTVKLSDPGATADLLEKSNHATRRIAMGLDMPAEMLMGADSLNHWSLWLVDRKNYEHHLDPRIVDVLGDLSDWWKALLEAAGIPSDRQVFWRNPDSAVTNPNRWEQLVFLWTNGMIDDDTLRSGADVGDVSIPTEEELLRRAIFKALQDPTTIRLFPSLAEEVGLIDQLVPQGIPESTNPAESDDAPTPTIQAATQSELDTLARRLSTIDQTLIVESEQAIAREAARLRRQLTARIAAAARAQGETVEDESRIGEVLGVAAVLALLSVSEVAGLVEAGDVNTTRVERAIREAQERTDRELTRRGLPSPTTRQVDRDAAVAGLAAAVSTTVAESVFKRPAPQGESRPDGDDIVPFAVVREQLDVAGGAAAARSADGVEAWQLVANGRRTADVLADGGFETVAFRWVYGTAPRQTFEPHLNLDGSVFERWDSDVLDQSGSGAEWVGGTHFYPGDHGGCRCSFERVMVDAATVQPVAASAQG